MWSLAGSLVAPLFDGGRRAAEVERVRAEVTGRLINFRAVYLKALTEVEDALASEVAQREHLERLKSEQRVARRLLEETRARYLEGLTDYLPVLNALQAVQRTERDVLNAQHQVLRQRIYLHRALGGDWTRSLSRPKTLRRDPS